MRIGIAQLNSHVGAIERNARLVIDTLQQGREQHNLDLILFPELMLTGYPPEDLLHRPALYKKIDKALDDILRHSNGIQLIIGYPRKSGSDIYNSCACINDGAIIAIYDKIELPNYGVFDEKRYFKAGTKACLIDLAGLPAAISICEDIWSPEPAKLAVTAGAKLIININASPFHQYKQTERKETLQTRFAETGLPIIYVNMVGGQDELVFDGSSMVMDATGKIVFEAPAFEEGLHIIDLDFDAKKNKVQFRLPEFKPATMDADQMVYRALVLAVRDYVRKNSFAGVVIGLSGGIDSALVTCIAVDALGPENVEVVLMPSRYTAQMSIDDSVEMAMNLNIRHHILSIEQAFSAFIDILNPLFEGLATDMTEENIQARCRGVILMAISNKSRKMVLTTGNKSEMAVGYATLYGDMVGGYAPLKDVPKLLVYRLSRWRNQRAQVIPERIIERPPTAELRENQKDEDSLPPYELLDPILERYIERDQNPQEIIQAGFEPDMVIHVTRLVDQNEYKRRQAAPGVKISKRAFGRERRYPITSGYREE
jgi:NAD+ synthase (glutamine-hydrolysing)